MQIIDVKKIIYLLLIFRDDHDRVTRKELQLPVHVRVKKPNSKVSESLD